MSALTILLIRHGEKPDDASELGSGLTITGVVDKHSLVVRGWQRAGAWTALFGSGMVSPDFPRPDIVYAADPEDAPTADGTVSKRPYETIVPLCERLHITPVTAHGVGDEVALVKDVKQLTGVVLICWEHKKIAEAILPELVKEQTIPHLLTKWHGDRFDVVLRLDRTQSDGQWSFRQLFPRLLSGDTDTPM